MGKTLRAFFDGQVLRPEGPVDWRPNMWYVVTIECEDEVRETGEQATYPLTEILGLATDMGVTDLSTRHSWYAHGRLGDDKGGTCH